MTCVIEVIIDNTVIKLKRIWHQFKNTLISFEKLEKLDKNLLKTLSDNWYKI